MGRGSPGSFAPLAGLRTGSALSSVSVSTRRSWLSLVALALLGSQAGHLLAYQLRFGAAAQQVQSSGAHVYFPALAKTGLGVAAALALAGLLMIGLARVISGRSLIREWSGPSYLRLVAAVFTIQLALFIAQELSESAAAGAPAAPLLALVFWGTLGQLPVAMIGALALRWLLTRLRSAMTEIRTAVLAVRIAPTLVLAVVPVARGPEAHRLRSCAADPSLAKRGPPSFSALSLG